MVTTWRKVGREWENVKDKPAFEVEDSTGLVIEEAGPAELDCIDERAEDELQSPSKLSLEERSGEGLEVVQVSVVSFSFIISSVTTETKTENQLL